MQDLEVTGLPECDTRIRRAWGFSFFLKEKKKGLGLEQASGFGAQGVERKFSFGKFFWDGRQIFP